jgi:hypothetical protein
MSVIGCHLMGADITPEKPTTEDVLNVMGYSWWKFSVPNEKKLKTLQCALFMYTKDKHGVWNKQQIHAGVFTQGKDIKPTEKFTIGCYQKDNEIVLKLESESSTFRAGRKYGVDELTQSATNLTLDENGDIILKWKSNGTADTGKKDSMQSYLAMHINIAEGLK